MSAVTLAAAVGIGFFAGFVSGFWFLAAILHFTALASMTKENDDA